MPTTRKAATSEKPEINEAEVMELAELGLSNPKVFATARKNIEPHNPELIEAALYKISQLQIAAQKMQLTVQLKKDEDRNASFDYDGGLDEFLLCVNRANQLSKELFATKTVNTQGSGDGRKRQRKIELKVGNETLNFTAFRKVFPEKKKEEVSE